MHVRSSRRDWRKIRFGLSLDCILERKSLCVTERCFISQVICNYSLHCTALGVESDLPHNYECKMNLFSI